EELGKINRVLDRLIKWEQRHNLLVIDATTGKNALTQAQAFQEVLPLHGAIVSKMDSNCGGGIVFSLSNPLRLPVLYEGQGERYEQLTAFDPHSYVQRLLGIQR
ncbi:MAG: signal recognition particle-docking protein FtsY, partial [Spirochaetota bacterium]